MTIILILLGILIVGGALVYAIDRLMHPNAPDDSAPQPTESEGCCGMHLTCEKDSLSTAISTEIIYYDDEDLDSFRGRLPDSYSDEESEMFREVLLTLLPDDIAGWARSLQLRGIEMPSDVKDELMLIVSEARKAKTSS